jgi:RND family efflux transporter MFP subunit
MKTDMKKLLYTAALLFIAVACKDAGKPETNVQPLRVRVTEVSHANAGLPLRAVGIVGPSKEMKLSFLTGGVIEKIAVKEGSTVKKGDLLAMLNLSEINSRVKQAANAYEMAVRDYSRAKNLYNDSVATLEQFQNAETGLNISKAALDMANYNLSHSSIYAPEGGIILKQLVEENEIIAPGYPVFLLGTGGESWKIRTGLADRDFVRVHLGDSARVMLDAYPETTLHAIVSRVSESANPLTGTYEIELDLEHKNLRLANGFVANLEIYTSSAEDFIQIPMNALVEADDQTGYVYVVSDSMVARKLTVRIAAINGAAAMISEGLENMNQVVTDGAAYLSDGDKVVVVK